MRKRTRKSIVAAAGLTTALTGLVAVHHAEPLGVLGGGHNKALAAEGQNVAASFSITPPRVTDLRPGGYDWSEYNLEDFSFTAKPGQRINPGDFIELEYLNLPHFKGGDVKATINGASKTIGRIEVVEQLMHHKNPNKKDEELANGKELLKRYPDESVHGYTKVRLVFNENVRDVEGLSFKFSDTKNSMHYYNNLNPVTIPLIIKVVGGDSFNLGQHNKAAGFVNHNTETFRFGTDPIVAFKDNQLFGVPIGIRHHTVIGHQNNHLAGDLASLELNPDAAVRFKTYPIGKQFSIGTQKPVLYNTSSDRIDSYSGRVSDNLYVFGYADPFETRYEVVESTPTKLVVRMLTDSPRGNGGRTNYAVVQPIETILVNKDLVDFKTGNVNNTTIVSKLIRNGKDLTTFTNNSFKLKGTVTDGAGITIPKGNVVIQYVSKTGEKLKEPTRLFTENKDAGTDYTVVPERIPGYKAPTVEGAGLTGVVAGGDTVIKLVYEKELANSNVSVQVVDEAGKAIRPNSTVFTEAKPEGTQYSVRKPRIAGYRFVRAEGELSGTLGKTDKTVKLVYKADPSVVAGTDPDSIEERKESVVPIPFETETRDTPELWQGEERVINPGAEGSKTIITTRQLDENQQPVGDPVVTENVTKQPVKRVIERGTKNPAGTETVTTEKPKPFKTVTRDNPDLYEGDERVVTEGKDGVTTVTTVYKTNKGKRTGDNPTVTETEKQPPVNRIVERGTKDPNGIDVVKEHEDVVYKTEYRDNPELYEGETRVIQEGELGSNLITKLYKTKKGKRTDEAPVVTKTTEKEPKNRIIERGTKPVAGVDTVVEDKELPFKLVVKDNPELTEGEERVVTEGTPGLIKKTTAYKTEKGKRVGDPTVTETVVKEPIDRVVERGTKPKTPKQTDADKNNPKGKDQTVFVGEKPDPKNSVENYNDLPEGTVVKWEKDPDTTTPGQKPSVLLFEYPDGSVERVSVIVTAVPKPEPKDQTVFVGETPKADDSIGNYPQLPEGTRVSWLVPPKTDKPGVVDGVVLIEYPDGRRIELPVRVTVVEREKEKQPPQQEQNNNRENGNNNNKDKVSEKSDNSDNSDKDTQKDKPTPQGKDQTVRVGEDPLVQDSIINHNDLPKGTKLSWEKTPDTTKPGVIEAVVLVEYPDGTSEKVTVRVTVVDDSDKNKEKNNHENSNKTSSDTNADNNKTPDKKELNQNKQPDRKESIKTGVGSVDQTTAGVALTATALALSAFALRRRKQQ